MLKRKKLMQFFSELEESDQLLEELQTEYLLSMNMFNTIQDMEFGNYYLMELDSFIPKLTNEDFRK